MIELLSVKAVKGFPNIGESKIVYDDGKVIRSFCPLGPVKAFSKNQVHNWGYQIDFQIVPPFAARSEKGVYYVFDVVKGEHVVAPYKTGDKRFTKETCAKIEESSKVDQRSKKLIKHLVSIGAKVMLDSEARTMLVTPDALIHLGCEQAFSILLEAGAINKAGAFTGRLLTVEMTKTNAPTFAKVERLVVQDK